MEYRTEIMIAAAPARVWQVMSELEQWPAWTPSFTSVKLLSPGAPGVGSRVHTKQPRLAAATLVISAWTPGQGFTWGARQPGLSVVAEHALAAAGDGCRVRLAIRFSGFLSGIVSIIYGKMIRQYVEQEAMGLKTACEAGSDRSPVKK
ncbi:SRPBCC family protein [Massilia sp. TS11]|uniref:SRPBCC family protein n=1 Tax=Massilia sp. TS11 TaxID=2908003 RepID=UPI001EDA455E|nr:SRPBCC family protein [Massilia sp. TS11]